MPVGLREVKHFILFVVLMQLMLHHSHMFSKGMGQAVRLVALITQVSQSLNPQEERGFKHVPLKAVHLAVNEFVGVGIADSPGKDF